MNLPFAFWQTPSAGPGYDNLPPTEGTAFTWQFVPAGMAWPQTVWQTISNPNVVTMTITWVDFPSTHFNGPFSHSIPPLSSYDFGVVCDGTPGSDTTTGTWSTSGGSGALTGDADNT